MTNLPSYAVFAGTSGRCGLGVHTIDWVRPLAEAGYPVTLIAYDKDFFSAYLKDSPVRVVHLPLPDSGTFQETFRAWSRALKPYPAQRAVLTRGVGGSCSLSVLAALRYRYPRLYTIEHAMANLPQIAWGKPELEQSPLRTARNKLAAWLVDRSISVAECTRQSVIDQYGFPENKIVTCHNWVDVDRFKPDRETRARLRAEYGIDENAFVIGFVGRLVKEKRVDVIINGFAEFMASTTRESHLVLVGAGMTDALRELTTELKLTDRVHFVGMVSDTAPWMSAIDTLILASDSEAFPLVGLEAMASGVVFLAQPVGGIPEYVEHGENGFLANMGTSKQLAVLWLKISNMALDERMRIQANARRTAVEYFRPEVNLSRVLETLDAPVAGDFLRGKESNDGKSGKTTTQAARMD